MEAWFIKETLQNLESNTLEDEFRTMRALFCDAPEAERNNFWSLCANCLESFELAEHIKFCSIYSSQQVQKSKELRQQGNRLFTAKAGKRNILEACRLYSDALYAAIDTSEELALAFANRAVALQAFGYFRQAYDDCVCALKVGYPESLRHKILIRQAYCSIKMQDLQKAEKHLNELQKLTLNASSSSYLEELLKDFDKLKHQTGDKNISSDVVKENSQYMKNQEIIINKTGRRMQAKCLIKKKQLIFTERASAFLPLDNALICHQCGTLNLIPIPCLQCHGMVNYCSLKCQQEHDNIHVYECPAYRFQFFSSPDKIEHLALRILLDNGLFTILDELNLKKTSSTKEVWRKLDVDGEIWKNKNIPYAETLRITTHFNKISYNEKLNYANIVYLLVVYLKHYTKYFEVLNARNKNIDWKLLTGTLLLRHISQFGQKQFLLKTLLPMPENLNMLNEVIWSSAFHLKLGFLHYFSNSNHVAVLILPYFTQCNYSCVPLFETKYSGRFVSTYALRNLRKGEEITRCCIDYRRTKQDIRLKVLGEKVNARCECTNCRQKHVVKHKKFFQYHCDNINCGKIFTGSFSLNWLGIHFFKNVFCTVCGEKQILKSMQEAEYLLSSDISASSMRRLYQLFKESEQYLLGFNFHRCDLANILICKWFTLIQQNVYLNDQDYCELLEVVKFLLNSIKQLFSDRAIEYVGAMTYLWDLMAKRKYKCSKAEMDEMLSSLDIISDDLKVIFLNYFNDYIKEYYNL